MNSAQIPPSTQSAAPRFDGLAPRSCDVFCNVIDNYGDIGVCWRLCRILAAEFGVLVRLWVDDLTSFGKLCPDADVNAREQTCRGVELRLWDASFPEVVPANLVIAAFACKLPQQYLERMAAEHGDSVWINLEYLSGEEWVENCHKLPSPHPRLPLTKYFFFPGFSSNTGGLLLENELVARRDAFQSDVTSQETFWRGMGIDVPAPDTLKISVFGYENDALSRLFDSWTASSQQIACLVPESRILPHVAQYFGDSEVRAGKGYSAGKLQVFVVSFVEQERYDEMLWACDINFVRGEDSCVRAQWAARPFVWQIYPQHDAVHLKKLDEFLAKYCSQLNGTDASVVRRLWKLWNSASDAEEINATDFADAWTGFAAARGELERHARQWAQQLSKNNLALNLLDFYQEIGRMRAFELEGQQS